jgi:hypothetical protein
MKQSTVKNKDGGIDPELDDGEDVDDFGSDGDDVSPGPKGKGYVVNALPGMMQKSRLSDKRISRASSKQKQSQVSKYGSSKHTSGLSSERRGSILVSSPRNQSRKGSIKIKGRPTAQDKFQEVVDEDHEE